MNEMLRFSAYLLSALVVGLLVGAAQGERKVLDQYCLAHGYDQSKDYKFVCVDEQAGQPKCSESLLRINCDRTSNTHETALFDEHWSFSK